MGRGAIGLALAAMLVGGCQRPTAHQDTYRPYVRPVHADPAQEVAAPQDRVTLLKPDLGPAAVRGPTQIDAFLQSDARVDILWIIDDSGSMVNKRARLAKAFDQFITTLVGEQVDYHIGVTTTDMDKVGPGFDGQLMANPAVITKDTPDPVAAFTSEVSMPANRVQNEEGLAAGLAAVTDPNASGPNKGFLRPGADLAMIVVSDEDDHSFGDPAYYERVFRELHGPGNEDTISFSAVIGDVPKGCTAPGDQNLLYGEAQPGTRYQAVAKATHGIVASVCSADFNTTLQKLGLSFSGLRRIFPLSADPAPGSLQVQVDGVAVPQNAKTGWTFDAGTRSVQFLGSYVPPPGSTVRIRYELKV